MGRIPRKTGAAKAQRLDPDYIALDLTYRCDLRCAFCFMTRSRAPAARREELTLGELKAFVDGLSQRPRRFYLAGGEPALRKDLAELVRHIKKRGHRCRITTNAFSLDERAAARLLRAGVDELMVSLHGPPATHDRLVGAPGAAARIERLFRFVRSRADGRTMISVWCTINRLNHARLHQAYRYFRTLGPDAIAFSHMDYITRTDLAATKAALRAELGVSTPLRASEGLASGISAAVLAEEIRKIKADPGPALRFFPDLSAEEIAAWYSPRAGFPKRGFCLAQWKGLWIGPRGEVLPCQPLGCELGNIRDAPALALFNGPVFTEFRKVLLRRRGHLPTCSRCGRSSYSSTHHAPRAEDAPSP